MVRTWHVLFMFALTSSIASASDDTGDVVNFVITISSNFADQLNSILDNVTNSMPDIIMDLSDVNECDSVLDFPCHEYANCNNTHGSFECSCKEGFSDLSGGLGQNCEDINECLQSHDCDQSTTSCVNQPGSYQCSCLEGFAESVTSFRSCKDADECASDPNPCIAMVKDYNCTNTYGSFQCSCKNGYQEDDDGVCQELGHCSTFNSLIDQLKPLLDNAVKGETGTDAIQSFLSGYSSPYDILPTNDGSLQQMYSELDPMLLQQVNPHLLCDFVASCSYSEQHLTVCTCPEGFQGDGSQCSDIDECAEFSDDCDPYVGTCTNTFGSYYCSCSDGYMGDGKIGSCRDIDEGFLMDLAKLHYITSEKVPEYIYLAVEDSAPAEGLCAGDLMQTDCSGECRATCNESTCSTVCVPGCACRDGYVRLHEDSTMCISKDSCTDSEASEDSAESSSSESFVSSVVPSATPLKDVTLTGLWACMTKRVEDVFDDRRDQLNITAVVSVFKEAMPNCIVFPDPVVTSKSVHFNIYQAAISNLLTVLTENDVSHYELQQLLEEAMSTGDKRKKRSHDGYYNYGGDDVYITSPSIKKEETKEEQEEEKQEEEEQETEDDEGSFGPVYSSGDDNSDQEYDTPEKYQKNAMYVPQPKSTDQPTVEEVSEAFLERYLPCVVKKLMSSHELPIFTSFAEISDFITNQVLIGCWHDNALTGYMQQLYPGLHAFDGILEKLRENSGVTSLLVVVEGLEAVIYPPRLHITPLTMIAAASVKNLTSFVNVSAVEEALDQYFNYTGKRYTLDFALTELENLISNKTMYGTEDSVSKHFAIGYADIISMRFLSRRPKLDLPFDGISPKVIALPSSSSPSIYYLLCGPAELTRENSSALAHTQVEEIGGLFTELAYATYLQDIFSYFIACNSLAQRKNTFGSYECECLAGFEGSGYGEDGCHDVNECKYVTCISNAECVNHDGGYNCTCIAGYSGDGYSYCEDLDECAEDSTNNCDVRAACYNSNGAYHCSCPYDTEDVLDDGTYCKVPVVQCKPDVSEVGENQPCDLNATSLSCKLQTDFLYKSQELFKAYEPLFFVPESVQSTMCNDSVDASYIEFEVPMVSSFYENPNDLLNNKVPDNPFVFDSDSPLKLDLNQILQTKGDPKKLTAIDLLNRGLRRRRSVSSLPKDRKRRNLADGISSASLRKQYLVNVASASIGRIFSESKPNFVDPHGNQESSLCGEVISMRSHTRARRYEDREEYVELLHLNGMFQWFQEVKCEEHTCSAKIGCVQKYSSRTAAVVTSVNGKIDVNVQEVYIESSCSAQLTG